MTVVVTLTGGAVIVVGAAVTVAVAVVVAVTVPGGAMDVTVAGAATGCPALLVADARPTATAATSATTMATIATILPRLDFLVWMAGGGSGNPGYCIPPGVVLTIAPSRWSGRDSAMG
ncbi:MAG: hypothetical protein U0R72_14850 [Nakamurella multipartita]